MSYGRQTTEQQAAYVRQATILRKDLLEWDRMLRTPRGEDWPTMLGRLNAALNQTVSLDRNIEDVMEHFVYVPKQASANPQDIPFFLSTRLETPSEIMTTATTSTTSATASTNTSPTDATVLPRQDNAKKHFRGDPIKRLHEYDKQASKLIAQYEENMVRY